MNFPHVDQVIRHLRHFLTAQPELKAYAILDCARDERIYPALVEACDDRKYRCLFQGHEAIFLGNLPRVLAQAAPHLIQLDFQSNFARWMISRGWGNNWGIYALSSAPLDKLLIHLRRFLMVKNESGKPFYFRYYDPRVMRVYLPSCNDKELEMVFGPLSRYCMESEDADVLREYKWADGKMDQVNIKFEVPKV